MCSVLEYFVTIFCHTFCLGSSLPTVTTLSLCVCACWLSFDVSCAAVWRAVRPQACSGGEFSALHRRACVRPEFLSVHGRARCSLATFHLHGASPVLDLMTYVKVCMGTCNHLPDGPTTRSSVSLSLHRTSPTHRGGGWRFH